MSEEAHAPRRTIARMDDPKRIVEAGYDAIAARYAEWARDEVTGSPNLDWLDRLLALLPERAYVLELGCGNGEPAARLLAERHRYTGVDISGEQLRLARELVPHASFLHADYTTLELEPASFDAIVALYTFGHVPQHDLPRVYERAARWLRPGGHLLATTGRSDDPGTLDEDWLGAPMYFASFDVETNLRLLAQAGLDVLEHDVVCQDEGEHGEACFLWVLARRR